MGLGKAAARDVMIEFRRLAPHEVPWPILDAFHDRVLFQTREWLAFIAESQTAEPVVAEIRDGTALAGYFSGLIVRKFGVRILGSSFPGWTTPYIGFNLRPGYSRSALIGPLIDWAFHEMRCLHVEISDRALVATDGADARCSATAYDTYMSDLTRTESEMFSAMSSACRRCIRKASNSGVAIEEAHDLGFADEFYEQLEDVFAKHGEVPTYTVNRVRLLLKHMLPTGRLLALRARNPQGRCIATGIYAGLNGTAHFWGNASWRVEQHWRPNELLHWYALRYWKARGAIGFDWGGEGRYKEKYGVVRSAVPWFYKSRYRMLTTMRDEARRLFYRTRGFVGLLRGGPVRHLTAGIARQYLELP